MDRVVDTEADQEDRQDLDQLGLVLEADEAVAVHPLDRQADREERQQRVSRRASQGPRTSEGPQQEAGGIQHERRQHDRPQARIGDRLREEVGEDLGESRYDRDRHTCEEEADTDDEQNTVLHVGRAHEEDEGEDEEDDQGGRDQETGDLGLEVIARREDQLLGERFVGDRRGCGRVVDCLRDEQGAVGELIEIVGRFVCDDGEAELRRAGIEVCVVRQQCRQELAGFGWKAPEPFDEQGLHLRIRCRHRGPTLDRELHGGEIRQDGGLVRVVDEQGGGITGADGFVEGEGVLQAVECDHVAGRTRGEDLHLGRQRPEEVSDVRGGGERRLVRCERLVLVLGGDELAAERAEDEGDRERDGDDDPRCLPDGRGQSVHERFHGGSSAGDNRVGFRSESLGEVACDLVAFVSGVAQRAR